MSQALHVNDDDFNQQVLQAEVPVLVDFYAEWCGPCRMMAPAIDQLAQAYQGKAKVVKVNVDQAPQTASAFRIASIPTLVFFNQGQAVKQLVGLQQPQAIASVLDEMIHQTA